MIIPVSLVQILQKDTQIIPGIFVQPGYNYSLRPEMHLRHNLGFLILYSLQNALTSKSSWLTAKHPSLQNLSLLTAKHPHSVCSLQTVLTSKSKIASLQLSSTMLQILGQLLRYM